MALILGASALALSAIALALLLGQAKRLPGDRPNARSLHERVMPRGGGLSIWAGFVPVAVLAPPLVAGSWTLWLAALALVAAVSFVDDLRGVGIAARLGVQLAAAGLVGWSIAGGASGWPLAAAIALVIAWSSNLFNFMDGSDGLAGTMAVVGFTAYAGAAAHAGVPWVAFAALALSVVPFLIANLPPARIFMGDVGAVPLGFLAASLGAAGVVEGWWPAWFPPLVFLPFLADASVTLVKRAVRGERVWEAHRSHYYQRIHIAGAGHRGVLAIYAAAMLACGALAVSCLVFAPSAGWAALAIAVLAHLIFFAAIDHHHREMNARER